MCQSYQRQYVFSQNQQSWKIWLFQNATSTTEICSKCKKLFLTWNRVFMFVCFSFFFFKTSYLYKTLFCLYSLKYWLFVHFIIFNLLIERVVVVWVIENVKWLHKYVYMEFFFTFFSITFVSLKCEYRSMVDNASNEPDDSSSNSNWNSLHSLRTNAFGISLLHHN